MWGGRSGRGRVGGPRDSLQEEGEKGGKGPSGKARFSSWSGKGGLLQRHDWRQQGAGGVTIQTDDEESIKLWTRGALEGRGSTRFYCRRQCQRG